jgi:hypothetical protein
MHGAIPPSIIARALLIMAGKFLFFLAPFIAVAATWWLVNRTDRLVNFLFPHLEWERSLGWLNIKAERRAKKALRWFGYLIQALLVVALLGMIWGAVGLGAIIDSWPNPDVIVASALQIAALFFSLAIWIAYLGSWLIPRLRAKRETSGLERFRSELAQDEEDERNRYPNSPSRVNKPLRKPRTNAPLAGASRIRKRL